MPVIIERTEVESSNIHSIGYDPTKRVLEVQFWKGRDDERVPGPVYRYYDVPESDFDNLMKATSKGKYLNVHIKNGGFQFEKVI